MVSSKLLKSNSPTGWTKKPYRAKKPDFFPCVIMANGGNFNCNAVPDG